MEESKELIYGLNNRPPLRETLFAAMQHLLAIFVAIITPPLIICSALKFDLGTTAFMVSMALFASGVATFIQCRRFGPIGTGLLCIQGTSFSFISPIIGAGMMGMVGGKMNVEMGLSYIFGGFCCRNDRKSYSSLHTQDHYTTSFGHRCYAYRIVPHQSRYQLMRWWTNSDG